MSDASLVQRITCENPSPMTLQGTNTYLVGSEAAEEVIIIDPGPSDHPEHLETVRAAVGPRRVSQILVTHRHGDHTGAAPDFGEAFAAPVRGHSPEQCLARPDQQAAPLSDGESIELHGAALHVLHTPGHTSDSVCFWLVPRSEADRPEGAHAAAEGQAMLTGDTILGEGTTMIDHPDGTLTDYLASLERLSRYSQAALLPAHGSAGTSVAEAARRYRDHRMQRLDQVRSLLARAEQDGSTLGAAALGELIYGERSGLPAGITTKIAAAQLRHLQHLGER